MKATSLGEVYKSVDSRVRTIYVVPLIRHSHKKTDYLYLLYKDLIKADEFDIQSISIFNHFKLVTGALRNKHVILHYHWLEFQDLKSILGMPWKILCIRLFKLFGGHIVWTLHNEFPHDRKFLKLHAYLHRKMAAWASKLHVHCEMAIDIMSRRLQTSKTKFFVREHPSYPADIQNREKAITDINAHFDCDLDASKPILLMFGNISRYKQIEHVAKMVAALPHHCKLLVVGPIKKGNLDLFKELQKIESKRLQIIPEFIKEDHVPWFYNAADICVFNYREILSSGGVHLALSYQKSIIAPNKGCISELATRQNVQLFDDQHELETLLIDSIHNFNGKA